MDAHYEIRLGETTVGQAQVCRQGLYYHVSCRCTFPSQGIYKILSRCRDRQVDLGICVPMGEGFGLDTRLPIKRLGEGPLSFQAALRDAETRMQFVPVYPEEPFAYLSRLKEAFLARKDGQMGLWLPETVKDGPLDRGSPAGSPPSPAP